MTKSRYRNSQGAMVALLGNVPTGTYSGVRLNYFGARTLNFGFDRWELFLQALVITEIGRRSSPDLNRASWTRRVQIAPPG